MLKDIKKRTEGFTIIEVLIVLAIAGLILLIVFLAVPALQRNSRNTQRKNDVQNILGGINEYVTNHTGQIPSSFIDFKDNVKLGYYTGSSDVDYEVNQGGSGSANVLTVYTGAKCSGAAAVTSGASSRNIAAVYFIETSGGTQPVCQES